MRYRDQRRQCYLAPCSSTEDLLYEQSLLAESARTLLYLDELENINKTAGSENADDFYFEIYEF